MKVFDVPRYRSQGESRWSRTSTQQPCELASALSGGVVKSATIGSALDNRMPGRLSVEVGPRIDAEPARPYEAAARWP